MGTVIPSKEARIETTNACNANCTICSRSSMTRPIAVLHGGKVERLLMQMEKMEVEAVSLFGFGEPLMDWKLPHKIKKAKRRGMKTTITSNGSRMDHNRSELFCQCGLDMIRFSVHGIWRDGYEAVHRGLKWRTVLPNILHFIWLNDTKFNHAVRVEVSVIPMHGELVADIVRFWEPFVDGLEIYRPHNWGGAKDFRKVVRKKRTCGRPENGPLQVQADGTVIPCCFLTNSEVILGDTNKQTLEEIWNGEPYMKLREAHRTGDLTGYPCEHCDQLNEYGEDDYPLLYSSRDPSRKINATYFTKYNLEVWNGLDNN